MPHKEAIVRAASAPAADTRNPAPVVKIFDGSANASAAARLRLAVRELEDANREMKRNVAEFQDTTAELELEWRRLHDNTERYRRALGRVDVKPLRRKAVRLAKIADGWLVGGTGR